MTDPQAFLSGVSDAQRSCLSEKLDPDRLMVLLATPDLAAEEERAAFLGCLEHETLLRVYLSYVFDETGALGVQSSACIRGAFGNVDMPALMMAVGRADDEEAAALTTTIAFFSTLSCLSEEELQTAGPALGIDSLDDRKAFQCLFDELGGPDGVAALMQPDAGPPRALFSAGRVCHFVFPGQPPPDPAPTPVGTPRSTPEPTSGDFPWQNDGLTQVERYALEALQGLESEHPAVAQVVLSFPWLTDNITRDEMSALTSLRGIANNDPALVERIVGLHWLADSITLEELFVLGDLGIIAHNNASMAHALMDFPWPSDGITEAEANVITAFRNISEEEAFDDAFIQRLLDSSWLADSVDSRHNVVVRFIDFVVAHDINLANSILDTQIFDDPVEFFSFGVIARLQELISNGVWEHIPRQPWFQDGLVEEDYVRIAAAYSFRRDEALFLQLLEGAHIRSENDILPLGEEVKLVAIGRSPTEVDAAFLRMRTAVFEIEKFLGVSWRHTHKAGHQAYAGVFVEPTFGGAATYRETPGALVGNSGSVIYHEMAHAYFGALDFPKWVSEGVAEFFQLYVAIVSEEPPSPPLGFGTCAHISTVQESIEYRDRAFEQGRGVGINEDCAYTTGVTFWLEIFGSLGLDVASSYLRELYWAGVANPEILTEAEIYKLLLSNTPPEQQEEFRTLYRRLHGGPIPE